MKESKTGNKTDRHKECGVENRTRATEAEGTRDGKASRQASGWGDRTRLGRPSEDGTGGWSGMNWQ